MVDGIVESGRGRRGRYLALLLVPVVVIAAVACLPASLGNATSRYGPSLASCAQFQAVPTCGTIAQPATWLSINGPYTPFAAGDPYATKCAPGGPSGSPEACDDPTAANGAKNPLYRKTGYDFAIDISQADVNAGSLFTVAVYDAAASPRVITPAGQAGSATDDCRRGAAPFLAAPFVSGGEWAPGFTPASCQSGDSGSPQNLDVQLWQNDGSDLTVSYTAKQLGITGTPCNLRTLTTTAAASYRNAWVNVCTFRPTSVGIFPLRIKSSALDSPAVTDAGAGRNDLAVRVTGGTNPRLYALGTTGEFANVAGHRGVTYLTEVPPTNAGRLLTVDLFDVGDAAEDGGGVAGPRTVTLLGPAAAVPATTPLPQAPTGGDQITSCRYNATPAATRTSADPVDVASTCTITTSTGDGTASRYDGAWLRIEYRIPSSYDCGPLKHATDCWFTLRIDGGPLPADRYTVGVTLTS